MKLQKRLRLVKGRGKRSIEWLLYGLFDFFALRWVRSQSGGEGVAVLHLELLGDAVIWLPYGQAMVRHFQGQGNPVVMIGDAQLEAFLRPALPGCKWFGIARDRFVRSPTYRWRTLRQLRKLGVGRTLNTAYPRDALIHDAAVRALSGSAWGFDAVYADRPCLDRWLSRRLYARLIPAIFGVHQDKRHQAFLRAVGAAHALRGPAQLPVLKRPLDEAYWILVPGGSRSFRRWSIEQFSEIAKRVVGRASNSQCVVLGTSGERALGGVLERQLDGAVRDLTGKTDLIEFVRWIAHAEFVVGNDSAAGHIAAAYGVPSVIIAGGGHWGRCYPYDPSEAPVRALPNTVGHSMPCYGCDWVCEHAVRDGAPYPCISGVTADSVWEAVRAVIDAQH